MPHDLRPIGPLSAFALGRELASPRQAQTAKFELENITALTGRMGHPERSYRSVHIAGTNGKGSTAAMLASILRAAGLRTGLYTSPHLLRINERMRVDGAEISDADFAATFHRVHAAIEELLATGGLAAHPTFFECVTAMAFDYFARQKVDIAVFEVGMGGRLDSTNVITPEVAVITQIDFDHENFLGHSIEEIAGEKAGIIKPGAWVVSAAGNAAARKVIRRRAAEQGARLVEIDSAYRVSELRAEDGRYRFAVAGASEVDGESARKIEITLPLAGRFQVRNALAAITAARLLAERGFSIDDDAIARGLATVRWPGGWSGCRSSPLSIWTGRTIRRARGSWWRSGQEKFTGRRIHLVYGAMRDKAVDEVAGLLFPLAATVTLTQSPQPRSISADVLATMTRHLARAVEVIPDPAAALEHAIELAAPEDIVFATGSLYLVGDLRRYWDARDAGSARAVLLPPAR